MPHERDTADSQQDGGGIQVLSILTPASDGVDATVVDPMQINAGPLAQAAGVATGASIAEVIAICETVPNNTTAASTNFYAAAKASGKTVAGAGGGSWSATAIPGAQCHGTDATKQWNWLHVCSFYATMPPTDPTQKVRLFRGVAGSGFVRGLSAEQIQLFAGSFAGNIATGSELSKAIDLLNAWWDRDVAKARLDYREPAEHQGNWFLYRNLPVDKALGTPLFLEGKPLRASSISVAASSVNIRRRPPFPPPNIHVGSPLGTGQVAVNDDPMTGRLFWRYPGYPMFALMLQQQSAIPSEHLIWSVSREAPTDIYTDPNHLISVGTNSPRIEDWMNEGHFDLWLRVNSR